MEVVFLVWLIGVGCIVYTRLDPLPLEKHELVRERNCITFRAVRGRMKKSSPNVVKAKVVSNAKLVRHNKYVERCKYLEQRTGVDILRRFPTRGEALNATRETHKASELCVSSMVIQWPQLAKAAQFCLNGQDEDKALDALADYNTKMSENDGEMRKEYKALLSNILSFRDFVIPDDWTPEQRKAFELCRSTLKLYRLGRGVGWQEFVFDFQEWHRECRSLPDADGEQIRMHPWLDDCPWNRVYWQWLLTGVPPV